jgi:hypothetical protein
MFRSAGNTITNDLVNACPKDTTAVKFKRKGAQFTVYVPGVPGCDAFNPIWHYEVDGLSRLMRTTHDVDLYRGVRERVLLQDKNTLSSFARIAVGARKRMNYTLLGEGQ